MTHRSITEITKDLEDLQASILASKQILKDAAATRQALLRELCAATATRQRRAKQDELPFEKSNEDKAKEFASIEPTDPPSPAPAPKTPNPWRKK